MSYSASGKSRHILQAASAALLGSVTCFMSPAGATTSCASLMNIKLPNTTITLAQTYAKGALVVGTTTAPAGLCRVAGTVKPSSDSNINFEVWIPTDGSWNGKYEQIGNGGFAGKVSQSGIAAQVARGYAAAATDDGTSGNGGGALSFIGHPDVQKDFGHRAIKVTTDNSKAIIKALTDIPPRLSYFTGCSDGGREALMEAQRYPDDFDGIIAGSPANDWVGLFTGHLWDVQAMFGGPQTGGVPDAYIPPAQLSVLSKAALAACIKKDLGVATDAFLTDPRKCNFDPSEVLCKKGEDASTCLTAPQVAAVKKIYQGPHSRNGGLYFPGYEPGSESDPKDWVSWITGTAASTPGSQVTFANGFSCNEVLGVATCNVQTLSVDSIWKQGMETVAPDVSSLDTDLKPFKKHGGKLIQYAGWADTAIAPENGLNYWRAVKDQVGGIKDFYRVFMVPGMAHCSGGPGPWAINNTGPVIDADHDVLSALEEWVEHDRAPEQIIGTKYVNDVPAQGIAFQRPLCVFPKLPKYDSKGNPNIASSFTCVNDGVEDDPRNAGPQIVYENDGH